MPLPAWLGRFNRDATNRVLTPVMRRVPPGAIVVHEGRHSGREYRTPVLAFEHGDEIVIALTYGRDVDWVANVLAAGRCRLERMGREHALVDPVLETGEAAGRLIPGWVRPALRTIGVNEALRFRRVDAAGSAQGA
jgi:deazaflavin-dependent oxidoreductase (nitroreductase family)